MKCSKMKLAEKVVRLDMEHDLGLRRGEVLKIAASLARAKADYGSDEEWLSAVRSASDTLRFNPLKDEIEQERIAVSRLCPVCGKVAEPITLMRGRNAYYCRRHRAVSPALAGGADEG
jgi:hypothetical protein